MNARRLLPLGLGVAALVAVVGIASHGRPLAGGRGGGPTATFFDYVATTLVLVAAALLVVYIYAAVTQRVERNKRPQLGPWSFLSALFSLVVAFLVAFLILHLHIAKRIHALEGQAAQRATTNPKFHAPPAKNVRNPHLRWDEIAIVLALAGATVLVVLATKRSRPLRPLPARRRHDVSVALDESIDDLRTDPDLRRAIIAAYARMETALGRVGLPRRPSEAPFEYMERALVSLETSAAAAHRLTALFEWAKFSHHEPEPAMRDEAVDALVAVREELRRPVEEALTA